MIGEDGANISATAAIRAADETLLAKLCFGGVADSLLSRIGRRPLRSPISEKGVLNTFESVGCCLILLAIHDYAW